MRRIALLLGLTVAACAAPRTEQALTPTTPAALGLTGAPAPAIDPEWWRSFGDPQLDRLVADATAGSPNLQAALARVEQAGATLSARRAERGPDASLSVQPQVARLSGVYEIPPPYAGTVRFVGTAGVNLAYDLDLFGRQRATIEGARASVRAAALDGEAARLALAGAVAQTYLDLARAEIQAGIARRTIGAREDNLRLVRAQIRNQLASKVQQAAAETLLAQAREALTGAEGARVLATDALAALAGHGPGYAAGIGPTALKLDAALPIPATLPADLLGRRADIAAAQARIEAAQAGRLAARRAYYPNINLGGLVGLQAIGLGNLFSLDAATIGAGPALSLPVFDTGRLRAGLAGAVAAVDVAVADYNARVVGAAREAADALSQTANLRRASEQQASVVRGLRQTAHLNNVRVASGLDSKLDLVDTDVRLLDAELDQANLATDAARARVQLVLALGGGFAPIAAQPAQGSPQ
ncbi:efflux transporter outer membrane subunit [uncultured Sphingomonas sp.]|uniref:efflux transporter outer membrane subunit n=1 Tax=uncultured Sphingomonas sp. TaxID=158754 RepID=UPI0035CADA53